MQPNWIKKRIRFFKVLFRAINSALLSVQRNRAEEIYPLRSLNDIIITVRRTLFIESKLIIQSKISSINDILKRNTMQTRHRLSEIDRQKLNKRLELLTNLFVFGMYSPNPELFNEETPSDFYQLIKIPETPIRLIVNNIPYLVGVLDENSKRGVLFDESTVEIKERLESNGYSITHFTNISFAYTTHTRSTSNSNFET